MRLKTRLSRKRAALLVRFLDVALPAATDKHQEDRFVGMTRTESNEVKRVLDDIYSDCRESVDENRRTGETN